MGGGGKEKIPNNNTPGLMHIICNPQAHVQLELITNCFKQCLFWNWSRKNYEKVEKTEKIKRGQMFDNQIQVILINNLTPQNSSWTWRLQELRVTCLQTMSRLGVVLSWPVTDDVLYWSIRIFCFSWLRKWLIKRHFIVFSFFCASSYASVNSLPDTSLKSSFSSLHNVSLS